MSDFAVSSGLQNFTKNFLKDSADDFHAWSQWAQGNLTFKEALKYSGGNREGREERLKIASGQTIREKLSASLTTHNPIGWLPYLSATTICLLIYPIRSWTKQLILQNVTVNTKPYIQTKTELAISPIVTGKQIGRAHV